MKLAALGDGAWRLELPAGGDRRALLDALGEVPRVVDAVVSEAHALVTFDPACPPDALEILRRARGATGRRGRAATTQHVIRVRYDGADLAEVAAAAGTTPEALATEHASASYVVVAVGFQPGFAYLRATGGRVLAPRRASPRPRVPARALAVAGPYTGVYPFASPGGWNLVGSALDFAPFSSERGATLALGDAVRFERVGP